MSFSFRDEYDMSLLRNKDIDVIASTFVVSKSAVECIAHAYANTWAGSPLRRLIVDTYTARPSFWIRLAQKTLKKCSSSAQSTHLMSLWNRRSLVTTSELRTWTRMMKAVCPSRTGRRGEQVI